mgnify:CR=1 FL=1
MSRVEQPPRMPTSAGIGAARPSGRRPSPGCSADARANSSVSVTPGRTASGSGANPSSGSPSAAAAAACARRPSAAKPCARSPRPPGRVRTRPSPGIGAGTVASVQAPVSYTVRKKSSMRPRDKWSASTFDSVAIHVQMITKPNLIMSANSSRSKSLRRRALDRPLAPDFWKAELSMKNCTAHPRHLCAIASTHATTVSPSRKSIGWRDAREPYFHQSYAPHALTQPPPV